MMVKIQMLRLVNKFSVVITMHADASNNTAANCIFCMFCGFVIFKNMFPVLCTKSANI